MDPEMRLTNAQHSAAKVNIETHLMHHCRSEMPWWTLLQVTFMENIIPGFMGNAHLKLTCAKGIGIVVARALEDPLFASFQGRRYTICWR
jgi:hypothetical protein